MIAVSRCLFEKKKRTENANSIGFDIYNIYSNRLKTLRQDASLLKALAKSKLKVILTDLKDSHKQLQCEESYRSAL